VTAPTALAPWQLRARTATCPHGFLNGICNARACREAYAATQQDRTPQDSTESSDGDGGPSVYACAHRAPHGPTPCTPPTDPAGNTGVPR
jgi:hypothetical protein